MAFTLTARGSSEAVYSSGGVVGDVFTPAENDIIVVVVNKNNATAISSVTGWSASWSQILINSSSDHHVHVWAARMGASPGSGQVNINVGSASYKADVIQIAGASTAGAVGSVFVQSSTQSLYNPSSPMAIPALSAFASATNLTLTIGADGNSLGYAVDSANGMTILQQVTDATTDFQTCISYKTSAQTTNNIVAATGFDYKWISGTAFEIAEDAAAAASLDDVNTDEIVLSGETGVTFTTSNFGSDINSAIITDGGTASAAFTSLSGTAGSYTANAPSILAYTTTAAAGVPLTSASHSVVAEVSDGTDTTELAITFSPPAGYALVEIASAITTEGSVFYNFSGGTPPDTSQVMYPTADSTSVSSNGTFSTSASGNVDMYYFDATAETWQQFSAQYAAGQSGSIASTLSSITQDAVANPPYAIPSNFSVSSWYDYITDPRFRGNNPFNE